ncbi:hypothetical protein [Nocardiopsis coralliicola]
MVDPALGLEALVRGFPLFTVAGEGRRGRVSSVGSDPVSGEATRAVVDFGSTPEGADRGPEVEVATRLWGEAVPERVLRGLCAERALMERRMRDPLAGDALSLGGDAVWSSGELVVDGRVLVSVVLESGPARVVAADVGGGVLVRVFERVAEGPVPGLRRVADAGELEPLVGRG